MDQIIDTVCSYYQADITDVTKSKCRKPKLVLARHVSQYFMFYNTKMTLNEIGEKFSRDHSTVIHGIRKINSQLSNKFDDSIKKDIDQLTKILSL